MKTQFLLSCTATSDTRGQGKSKADGIQHFGACAGCLGGSDDDSASSFPCSRALLSEVQAFLAATSCTV